MSFHSGDIHYAFKETRLNLEPSSSANVVNIRIPPAPGQGRTSASSYGNGTSGGRRNGGSANGGGGGDSGATEEEIAFRRRNLATESSVFFRPWHDSPRAVLWRVLEDDAVLSVRAADVCRRERAGSDAPLVLNFRFAAPLRPGCVAFADSREHDVVCVFALDAANALHAIHLRPEAFRKRSVTEGPGSVAEICRSYVPAQLNGFKHPHRLAAASADELVVTLHDGGIIRLDRNKGHDAASHLWKETINSAQRWTQSLKSLIPIGRSDTVRHGRINMELSAAVSVRVTDLGLDDRLFLFTVCLDHQMRIWDLRTGQILYTGDILNADRNPPETGKWTIDPTQTNLIQVVADGVGKGTCVTFSPVGSGEFKIWDVAVSNEETIQVEDRHADIHFDAYSPTASHIWTLADFALATQEEGPTQMWALWKNNMTYRVQRWQPDSTDLAWSWQNEWDNVYVDTSVPIAQTSGPCDPMDATEKWLQTILYPGQYTKATLETALSLFERSVGVGKDAADRSQKGLAEAICSVIASTALLDRNSSGEMDYEQFRASSELSWRRFSRLIQELERQRGEALSLAYDPESDTAWVACTDTLCANRELSDIEQLCFNPLPLKAEPELVLVPAGLAFLEGFSDNIWQLCNAVLRTELFEDSSKTDYERMQHFFDKAGFWRTTTDEDCAQVAESLGGGGASSFGLVTDRAYDAVFDMMSGGGKNPSISHPLTEFGRRLVVRATHETVELQWKVCFSQLVLLVHMVFESEQEEHPLQERIDVGAAFRRLVDALRRLEFLRWLTRTEISVPVVRERSGSVSGSSGSPVSGKRGGGGGGGGGDETYSITALEGFIGHLLGFGSLRAEPLATTLTNMVSNLCATDSDVEVSPTLIQCTLVKRDRADLALELAPFCDQNPFSVYVQGRVFLALRDYNTAAIHFKKAAIGMSVESADTDRHGGGLLDDTEWGLLNKGLAKYYTHIVAIFERSKAYSYVVDFGRLGIQFARFKDHVSAVLRTELNSRVFNAALLLSRFDVAHTALVGMEDEHIQQASLRKLVERMCETYHSIELASLPFPGGLSEDVDRILEERCKQTADVVHGIPYHQVLYAWRVRRQRHQAAALVLYDRIQKLRRAGEADRFQGEHVLESAVTREYLLCINALSILPPKERWILPDELATSRAGEENGFADEGCAFHQDLLRAVAGQDGDNPRVAAPFPDVVVGKTAEDGEPRRRLVTLDDIRREYRAELERIAAIQNNQFGFEADDMDTL